jgi:hypothetical protein
MMDRIYIIYINISLMWRIMEDLNGFDGMFMDTPFGSQRW